MPEEEEEEFRPKEVPRNILVIAIFVGIFMIIALLTLRKMGP